MRSEKTKHSHRRGAALALAVLLLLAAAAPAAAGPLNGKGEGIGAVTPLVEAWEGVWGWLTAVWGEQGSGSDPDCGTKPPPNKQGHGIDPDGQAGPSDERGAGPRS
jgi:hypothetical protein